MAPASPLINKLKVQLRLAISRLRMVQQKDTAVAKQQRRAMAQLLEQGREESARIRVENIIRSDITTELLEILELYCELLLARAGLLEAKDCDPGLEEAVKSIIYAAPRLEVKELATVRHLLAEKYGKDFAQAANDNSDDKVAPRVLNKLRVEPPAPELVEAYLSTIADAYDIDWPKGSKAAKENALADGVPRIDQNDGDDDDDEPSSGQKIPATEEPLTKDELSRATPPRNIGDPKIVRVMPPSPSTENVQPKLRLPSALDKSNSNTQGAPVTKSSADNDKKDSAPKAKNGPGGSIPDVDELAKRFAQLKR